MSVAATYPVFLANSATDFARPDFSDLTLDDAATALSRLYRWRGCVPVSVAHHSVYMSTAAHSDRVARWCLLHDLHEIAITDLPAPAKRLPGFTAFNRAEERFIQAVADRFGLTLPMPAEVHRLDMRARASEVRDYLPHAADVVRGIRPLPKPLEAWSPARAKREFLTQAKRLEIV